MIDIFYDAEFHEDGTHIDPLSIGMCCEVNGELRKLYLVQHLHPCELRDQVEAHPFLRANVLQEVDRAMAAGETVSDMEMRDQVLQFVRRAANDSAPDLAATRDDVQLWGYYSAYDHVLLAQLFGTMMDLPEPIPMFTMDIRQEMARLGVNRDQLPNCEGAHNALVDAEWNMEALRYLRWYEEFGKYIHGFGGFNRAYLDKEGPFMVQFNQRVLRVGPDLSGQILWFEATSPCEQCGRQDQVERVIPGVFHANRRPVTGILCDECRKQLHGCVKGAEQ